MRVTSRGTLPVKQRHLYEDLRDACSGVLGATNYAESYIAGIYFRGALSALLEEEARQNEDRRKELAS